MERCKCDLLQAILQSSQGKLTESIAGAIFGQLLSALDFCHTSGIFHGDIKPENVLVSHNGTICLSDFFLDRRTISHAKSAGSAVYLAPEIVNNTTNDLQDLASADVWSLGVTLYVMTTGTFPWKQPTRDDLDYRSFTSNPRAFLPSTMSFALKNLLIQMLDEDVNSRLSLENVWSDPWVSTHKNASCHSFLANCSFFVADSFAKSPRSEPMSMESPHTDGTTDSDWNSFSEHMPPIMSPSKSDQMKSSFDISAGLEAKTSYVTAFGVLASPSCAQSKRPRLGSCGMPPPLTRLIA